MLTDDELNEPLNNNNKNEPNNNRLAQKNSLCSEPATTCIDERPLQAVTASVKCPCSTSYPNFQAASGEQPSIGPEKESSGSTSSSKQLIKSLRNKLRFSGENSFEEQAIALNEFNLDEQNNNSLMKSSDQTSLINSVPNIGSPTNHNSLPNNDKCNTIFLGGLNENNLTLKMDNV